MKLTRFTNLLVVTLVLTLAATGCKHKTPGVTPLPKPGATGETGGGPGTGGKISDESGVGGATTGLAAVPAGAFDKYTQDAEMFKSDTVHFAYDSSVVRPDEKSKVAAVADFLKANKTDAVRIEGYCDERGTEEYNRALGDRRAQALREELARQGADATRIDTISYGKDRPVDPGHDEAAWKKNRRGVFIHLIPPK